MTLSPTLSTPSARLSLLSMLSMLSNAKAAPCTASVVKIHASCHVTIAFCSRTSRIKEEMELVNGRGKALHKGWFGLCLRHDELWVSVSALGFLCTIRANGVHADNIIDTSMLEEAVL